MYHFKINTIEYVYLKKKEKEKENE
jgi:hypothetical protein